MRSIRHQLLLWLLAIVVAGVGAAGWLIYRQALAEANELFDYQLQEIAAASSEQASGVGQINAAVGQLSQATQQNASSSEELAATAEEMSGQAEQLQQAMSFFKLADRGGQPQLRVASSRKPAARKPVATGGHAVAGNLALAPAAEIDESQFTRF